MNKNNTSYFNQKLNKIFWRVDWAFHGTNMKFSDHKYYYYYFFIRNDLILILICNIKTYNFQSAGVSKIK